MKTASFRKYLILALAAALVCGCCAPAACAEAPAFRWKGYEARFSFMTTDIGPFDMADTVTAFFPESEGNVLLVRLEAAEGTIANADFQPGLFRLVMPGGETVKPLCHQIANMTTVANMRMPASQQDYFHLLFDRGSLTEETVADAAIAVYEDEDGEPVAVIPLRDVPVYAPNEAAAE